MTELQNIIDMLAADPDHGVKANIDAAIYILLLHKLNTVINKS